MENKIIKYFISFILSIALLIAEIILMVQFNISRGITKKDINKIIDNINIENEIIDARDYKELEEQINPEVLGQIIRSEELNNYIKENAKALYSNILYNENNAYINSDELRQFINNVLIEQQELVGITDEDIELINKKIDNMIKEIEESIGEVEIHKNDIKIVSTFISKKTTTYILGINLLIAAAIILINKSKDGYVFVGISTLIVGTIFFVLWLALSKTIVTTGIDEEIIKYVSTYLATFLNTLKRSSILMMIIGAIGCITYTVLHYQEVQSNGEI